MRIVSYNVHRCIGADCRQDPDRIAAVLCDLQADVIGLQEVDCDVTHEEHVDQLAHIADHVRMEAVSGAAMLRAYGGYGNAVLTRHRVTGVERHALAIGRREPRGALRVGLETAELGPLSLWVTHFGLRGRERRAQSRSLCALLEADDTATVVLMGDFNEWWRGPVTRCFDRGLGRAPGPRTFPSWWPLLRLDRLWVRPPERLVELVTLRSAATRIASDHLPLVARLEAGRPP